jgi:CHRD domain-containing protein
MRVRSILLPFAVVLALTLSTLLAATASATQVFHLTLTGAAEAPGPGDPDGTGTATLWFNRGQTEVCYDYTVSGVAPLTAAHIHVAPAGSPGPVVIPLPPTSPTGGSGCVTADRELIKAITKDPPAYYFNVHNADFPAGALRAQLG